MKYSFYVLNSGGMLSVIREHGVVPNTGSRSTRSMPPGKTPIDIGGVTGLA